MEPVGVVEHDKRIQLPAHALFVGASMSGKTRLATHLCISPHLFNPAPKTILFYYDQFQPHYLTTKQNLERVGIAMHLRRGSKVCLDELPHQEHQTILLIDDASEETASSTEIARIATNGRHKNISLWLIWHSLFSKHPASRVISQNVGLFFFLPSLRIESQLQSLASQLGMKTLLLDAYRKCIEQDRHEDGTKQEHRYLLLDLCPNTPKLLRLRSHIHLPVQYCYA